MIYRSAVALAFVAAVSAMTTLYTDDVAVQKTLFEDFKVKYNKKYQSVEEEDRKFATFVEKLKVVDERNLAERNAGGQAVHDITKFADMSTKEFQSTILAQNLGEDLKNVDKSVFKDAIVYPEPLGVVQTKNYSMYGSIQDQGICGNGWAWAVTEQLELDYILENNLYGTDSLSVQQVTACCRGASGCAGGLPEQGFVYTVRSGGLMTDWDYPYTCGGSGNPGSCLAVSSEYVMGTDGYNNVAHNESSMKSQIMQKGPMTICIDSTSWDTYASGIMSVCTATSINHCAQIDGLYYNSNNINNSYWQVKNSWGTGWGERGYIRLRYGQNTCLITNNPLTSNPYAV